MDEPLDHPEIEPREDERVTIELPADAVMEARDAVEAGEFPSVEAAVAQALDAWTADRIIARIGIDEIRRRWDASIASGPSRPLDFKDLLRRALDRADQLRRERGLAG